MTLTVMSHSGGQARWRRDAEVRRRARNPSTLLAGSSGERDDRWSDGEAGPGRL